MRPSRAFERVIALAPSICVSVTRSATSVRTFSCGCDLPIGGRDVIEGVAEIADLAGVIVEIAADLIDHRLQAAAGLEHIDAIFGATEIALVEIGIDRIGKSGLSGDQGVDRLCPAPALFRAA